MISIDGSHGEGGGQVIRTALALSALTGQPFKAFDIRAKRRQPGLKAQHLSCIKALERLCSAQVVGAELAATEFSFRPGEVKGKNIPIDIGTAGSVTLLLQSCLLPTLFADEPTRFRIKGGTDTKWAMPIDYFSNVFLPHIRRFAEFEFSLERRGYYPKGGGSIDLKVRPIHRLSQFPSFTELVRHLRSGPGFISQDYEVQLVKGMSHASSDLQKASVADRQARAAKLRLGGIDAPKEISVGYYDSSSTGSGLTLWALCSVKGDDVDMMKPIVFGSDTLGERGKRAEMVGEQAADGLLKVISGNATADSHLADNLIPLLAVAGGSITVSEITDHTRTNIWVCEKFLPVRFRIEGNRISC
ncbi:MAG: RNA 3'-terminal phosphate cyclase [Nanoarchaeota archaeon]|nr:RNA 3'-terminal phosphate cyclase [Nanoarchaeota archaeon]